jgi:hypothetical protein
MTAVIPIDLLRLPLETAPALQLALSPGASTGQPRGFPPHENLPEMECAFDY